MQTIFEEYPSFRIYKVFLQLISQMSFCYAVILCKVDSRYSEKIHSLTKYVNSFPISSEASTRLKTINLEMSNLNISAVNNTIPITV